MNKKEIKKMSRDNLKLVIILQNIFWILLICFAGIQVIHNQTHKVEFNDKIILCCPYNDIKYDYLQDMCEYHEYDYSQDLCPIDNNLYCPYYVFEGGF